jgi:hypothetical protein
MNTAASISKNPQEKILTINPANPITLKILVECKRAQAFALRSFQ